MSTFQAAPAHPRRATGPRARILARLLAGLCLLPAATAAWGQARERLAADPPQAVVERPGAPGGGLDLLRGDPAPVRPLAGEARVELRIDYSANGAIYNPATGRDEAVRLRTYVNPKAPPSGTVTFVAPTVEVMPGDTVRIGLDNALPKEPDCAPPGQPINTPHCFNHTNLHSHGLWVSPAGNSDNVLLSINPGVRFEYEYNIPPDHPAGTFWYHPHRHGSTALQVSSGMAGALVVRGARLPAPGRTGDVDTLLREPDGRPVRERVVLLQQIQYACRDASGQIKTNPDGTYRCDPGDVGGIEGYDQFGPGSWPASGRYTTINGEVMPTFADAQAGRVERWRFIHAGVRDTVQVQVARMRPGAEPFAGVPAAQQDAWIARNCPGPGFLPQFALASDGLTRGRIVQRDSSTLQPGYREDLLLVFPEAGEYCVIDAAAPAAGTVNAQARSRRFLGKVAVAPGAGPVADPRARLQAFLAAAAERMPASVRQRVRDDIADGLRLASFVPHPDVRDEEVTGKQNVELAIRLGPGNAVGFLVDGQSYDPKRIDRTLILGGVDQWTMTAGTNPPVGHPFHIHVNPFQVVSILNPAGVDVSVTGEPDDPQYAALKGVWRDTIFVKPGYQVIARTRYQRYIGDFVLHCHILDHEDQGMMQNVRIALPDGVGGAAAHQH